ncbi:MAG: class B sortase [Ruminococcus sp.]|nr:class B sortase [Ruminococcus sp.]
MNKTAKIITACAACAAAVGLCAYVINLSRDDGVPTFSNVEEVETITEESSLLSDSLASLYDYVPSPTGITEKAKIFLRQNSDYIGWISIDNTQVDGPIVLDPGEINPEEGDEGYGDEAYEANSYYLDHDINRQSYRAGTLFMDYRDVFGSSEEDQSENLIIYGHNMANNTMFGSLRKYRQDYSFYDESPFIELSSLYEDYQYVIFGFMITSGNWYTDFRYWDMEELDTEEEFNSYVETIKNGSMVDTGVDVQYGDKLLTLSTCYADEDNSRFLVVARRLRDNETAYDFSSIDKTEEYIQQQEEAERAALAAEEAENTSGESEADSE